jgi:predicted PurR-regulated permease PerM
MTDPDHSQPPQGGNVRFHPDSAFVRKVLIVALIAVLVLALWRVSLVLILTFGGVLVALAVHSLAWPLQKLLRLPPRGALILACLLFCAIIFGVIDLVGTLAWRQFSELYHRLPEAMDAGRQWLQGTPLGRQLLVSVPNFGDTAVNALQALPLAGGLIGNIGEGLLVLVAGIYFAVDPHPYTGGLIRLLPQNRRARAHDILWAIGAALRQWLIGMSFDMLLLSAMIFLGLWLIGMPYAFALALLSGVAVFVPYIGPAVAVIPGILIALTVSPVEALYAGGVYLAALTIEGNITQPMLQRWAVSIPPVVNLLAILVFSPLFGLWGAVLATPLSVALWVLVKMVYVEDILKDRTIPPTTET